MGITNSKPKKHKLAKPAKPAKAAKPLKQQKPAKSFFESEKRKEQEKEQEKKDKEAQLAKKRRPHADQLKLKPQPVSADSLGRGGTATTPARPASQEPTQSYDQEAIERMRKQLRADASAFLLNNIMLSVQFFENYEKVVWDLKNNSVTDADVLLNDKMAQHHKHVFLPDKLQEAVHVHARLGTGPGARGPPDALQPQRMFVVHDNVEVNEPGEVSDYSTVLDAPYYRMLMEEDDEPGYVKLKKLEILENRLSRDEPSIKIDTTEPLNKPRYSSDSETESEESGIKSKDEEITEGTNFMNELKEQIDVQAIKKPNNLRINLDHMIINNGGPKSPRKTDTGEIIQERRPSGILKTTNKAVLHGQLQASEHKQKQERQRAAANKVSPSGSESSGYRTSYSPLTESSGNESDYGYATITAATTPRKLQKSRTANFNDSTSIIPAKCITAVSVKTFHDDSEDEDEIDEAYSARYGTQFQRMYYLNSFTFMGNFSDIFLMKLAHSLGLAESLNDALTQGASIYCNVKKGLPKSISFEIIPALNTTWPNIAQEWVTRRRKMIRNPRTNFTYQWPTQVMVGKARGLGCLIVPLGFRPTRGTNPDQNLQWKLTFPAVERFLETCLAHSHVRCYLFTLVLFRTFIKNDASKAGLDYTHVRNHLFTQCEDNYAMWPEDRLGETLRIFMKSFYQLIMRGRMSDYFIPKCNILKGIPTSILLKQQRMLADILESPVMHLLSSLRNLKYMTSNFYPVLDYQKLYKILTSTDVLKMMNPNLPSMEADSDDSDNEITPTTGFWQDLKNPPKDPRDQKVRDTGYQRRKNYLRNIEAKKAGESLVNNRKTIREPIDRKAVVPPHLEANKRRLILELFIPHFLAMAESSERLEASRQAIIYLEHANRLSVLLKGEAGGEGAGREFIAIIREKIEILKDKVGNPGAPQVPRRNESFNSNSSRAGTSGIKKLKSDQYMNLENVNTSDHHNIKAGEPVSPTVKLASIVLADVHVEKEKPKFIRAFSFQKVEEEDEDGDEDEDDEEEDDSGDDATETNL